MAGNETQGKLATMILFLKHDKSMHRKLMEI